MEKREGPNILIIIPLKEEMSTTNRTCRVVLEELGPGRVVITVGLVEDLDYGTA